MDFDFLCASVVDVGFATLESMLKAKLLRPEAKPPTIAHPGEDLGYDLYAAESVTFVQRGGGIVPTGISIEIGRAHV
jgi:dUTPase